MTYQRLRMVLAFSLSPGKPPTVPKPTVRPHKDTDLFMLWTFYCGLYLLSLSAPFTPALAKSTQLAKKPIMLPAPTDASSLETLSRGAMGVVKLEKSVLALALGKDFGTLAPFNEDGKTREKVFGEFSALGKPQLMGQEDVGHWINLVPIGQNYMAFDAYQFAWVELDSKFKEILRRSIAWDLILPPRDTGGEATKPEVAEFRQRFFRNWRQTLNLKAGGVARALPKWNKAFKGSTYMVALKVSQFPLAMMECGNKDEPSQCRLTRGCFIEGGSIAPNAVTGIGVSQRRNLIVIGDEQKGELLGYTFHSCFHVTHEKTWVLPKTLKTLSHVSIDDEDRLWVTTAQPDDYLNASVFYWPKESW